MNFNIKRLTSIFIGINTIIFIVFLVIANVPSLSSSLSLLIIGSVLYGFSWFMALTIYYYVKRRRIYLSRSFNYYVEKLMATTGVGIIVYNDVHEIIWVSEFIETRLGNETLGKNIHQISEEFEEKYSEGKSKFRFTYGEIVYETVVKQEEKVILLKDVTNEDMLHKQYSSESLIIGELEIDNYQQFQVMLSEEEVFKIKSAVIKMLDKLVDKYNFVYKEYANGKYFMITNKEVLDKLIKKEFNFLNQLRKIIVIDNIKLSASLGFGGGSALSKELIDLAKEGLLQAQSRGGDQVCVSIANKHPQYYGSKTELASSISRVKIKKLASILENKLNDPKIKKVVLYGHRNADLDAVGSTLGMASMAQSYGKDVYIQNITFDSTTQHTIKNYLPKEYKDIFISQAKARKLTTPNDTLVIVCDTSNMALIENSKAFKDVSVDNIFILDHHRIKSLPSNIKMEQAYIDPSSSSTSEIVVEIFQFIKKKVRPTRHVAQMLLNGIYLDTVKFTKTTTSRTFEAASWLGSNGADSKIASEILKLTEEASVLINNIMSTLIEVKPGHFLASYAGEVPQDIISQAADEILRTQGRKAAYVIAKVPGEKRFKLSARSVNTNVQVIAEKVGGGGHYAASAAVSDEPLNIFTDNVVQAIIDTKSEIE